MEPRVKAHLQREEGEDKIRRFKLTLENEESGTLDALSGKLVETFPRLKDNAFRIKAKDNSDKEKLLASDKDVSEALSAHTASGDEFFTIIVKERKTKPGSKRAWRKRIKDSIPKAQRRWAKSYISEWRKTNLINPNEESGEESEEVPEESDPQEQPPAAEGDKAKKPRQKPSREDLEIPEAYQLWLDGLLVRWHRKWGGEVEVKKAEVPAEGGEEKKEDGAQDSAVPREFRKWARIYLNVRYGKKVLPQMKQEIDSEKSESSDAVIEARKAEPIAQAPADPPTEEASDKKEKKKKAPIKFRALSERVPQAQRRWAKTYIRKWRLENLENASSASETEGSDKVDKQLDRQGKDIPESFPLWLDFMLPRWHRKWGGAVPKPREADPEKVNSEKTSYRSSVPRDFRVWVKAYLDRCFGKKDSPELAETDEAAATAES